MNKEILQKAIDTYGVDAQSDMAIEEMSELTKEILKLRRAVNGKMHSAILADCKFKIADEIADVEIMLTQLKMMHNCEELVEERKEYKVNRLNERLEG